MDILKTISSLGTPAKEPYLGSPKEPQLDLPDQIFRSLGCTEDLTRDFIKEVLGDIILFDRKQSDRGPENIIKFGEKGVLVRVVDKVARLEKLVWEGKVPKISEPVESEWADISNYGVIARLVRSGEWKVSQTRPL